PGPARGPAPVLLFGQHVVGVVIQVQLHEHRVHRILLIPVPSTIAVRQGPPRRAITPYPHLKASLDASAGVLRARKPEPVDRRCGRSVRPVLFTPNGPAVSLPPSAGAGTAGSCR